MKFPAVTLREALWDDAEGFETIQDKIIDKSRWSIIHDWVFKYQDKFYNTTYSVGATESQDEGPFEYDVEVECCEVVPYEKTTIAYKKV